MRTAIFVGLAHGAAFGQSSGRLSGKVTLGGSGAPVHNVTVTIVRLRRSVLTGEDGTYSFADLPPGRYNVVARLDRVPDAVRVVEVREGEAAGLDFALDFGPIRDQVTVTATGGSEEVASNSFQSVSSFDLTQLSENNSASLGEAMENIPGVAKRSFGPGSSRPVLRGFDGDRVLIMQDGLRVGSLGSQSGDHGEPIDPLTVERIEVVKGPAALLYGSNAIGGVVNAITGHDYAHRGLRGFATGVGGTANGLGGASGGFEYGWRKWMVWVNGGGERTGDYDTPLGEVLNSGTRSSNGSGGFGRFGERGYFTLGYGYDNRRYGVPFAAQFEGGGAEGGEEELIDLAMRRHNLRFTGGATALAAPIEGYRVALNYSDYEHKELGNGEVGTLFSNKLLTYRGTFDQQRWGRLRGSFGFDGQYREYRTTGAEALAPPVTQQGVAGFTLQELDLGRLSFQFGGRVENNRYRPEYSSGLPARSFTGFSGAAGARFRLWEGAVFVANYTHSYRAPALEELYNFGPHIGTLTFEVGNARLDRERGDGVELALRHSSERLRVEASAYYYKLRDFIFLAPTGEVEDNLPVADYAQGDSRYLGAEAGVEVGLSKYFWATAGLDYVDAELTDFNLSLPRIPPVRARVGFDARVKGLSVRPEVVMARDQRSLFPGETRTAGYGVVNLRASYTVPRQHSSHTFSVNGFNLNDKLYRNHLSFIKELAPEIGRGVRFAYTIRFY